MSPFDTARYSRLLKGLEATEIAFSDVRQGNEVFRTDAEYFGKTPLEAIACLRGLGAVPLGELATITDGIHTSLPFVADGEVKVLSAKHPKENYVDRNQFETVTASFHAANPRTALRENDVLISTVGTIGNSAVVTADLLPANSDRHVGIIRLDKSAMSPYLLSTFLLGRYGRIQSSRETTGSVQPNLFISKICRLLIPRFSERFEDDISTSVQRAYQLREKSAKQFEQAEAFLFGALGLENWQAPEQSSYVRNSRDAFAAGRVDAEYFHPARTEALAKLDALSDCRVGDLFDSIRKLWQPNSDSGSAAVRNYDLNDALSPFLDESKEATDRKTIASTKKVIRTGDLVVSRLRSYLKEIAIVQSSGSIPMVASTEFIVLRPKKSGSLPAEALMIYLRSELPQIVLKWSQDGSNHPRFDEKELLRLPIPKVLIQQAGEYVAAVRAAISLLKQASHLLDAAKRAVEIAIEDSEAAALEYLASLQNLSQATPIRSQGSSPNLQTT